MPVRQSQQTADGLTEKTRATLLQFLRDIRELPNEAAKRVRFSALVADLFPDSVATSKLAAGVEHLVHIPDDKRKRRGNVDSYYGNAVIEFENSLRATGDEAERQLREYSSGVWAEETVGSERPLLCIASDGETWKTYLPRTTKNRPKPDEVVLEPLRTLTLDADTVHDFWVWLTALLFGGGRFSPTPERFRVDFGARSPAYASAISALREAWGSIKKLPERKLAFEAWKRYLTVTYGKLGDDSREEELTDLFLKHTYLACVARLLVWAAISHGKTTRSVKETAHEVLSGDFFRKGGIENLVEEDFFQWVQHNNQRLALVWERLLAHMQTYALETLTQDVLKGVYQELVDPSDRHDLGEYYTPEWLCERIAEELLPAGKIVRVLDPTCGSGSFLRAAISRFRPGQPVSEATLRKILDSVMGIDIHPLAVIIARATYVLALGPLIRTAKRPIQIPVFLADSLFLPTEVSQHEMFVPGGEGDGIPEYQVRFADRTVYFPETFVKTPELFDDAIGAAAKVAADHSLSFAESKKTLTAYLSRSAAALTGLKEYEVVVEALWVFVEELADLIRKRKNSIWTFIIRNAYRPAMLRDRFDVILGNPPWLAYRYIADPDYQAEVKKRATVEYGIAPGPQKLVTQMELATIFLVHTLSKFGRPGARLAFVMPRSILNADQHEVFRKGGYKAPVRLDAYWDLLHVAPLFNVPACVVLATRVEDEHRVQKLPALEFEGRLPRRDVPWIEAAPHLHAVQKTASLIFLGGRSALSTQKGRSTVAASSAYADRFRQGATLVPRNFYFVRIDGLENEPPDFSRLYSAATDRDQAELAKAPWAGVMFSGGVEGRFIFSSMVSRHVLPFATLPPALVVLPVHVSGERLEMITSERLRESGYRDFSRWMARAEKEWTRRRKDKASRQSVYDRLDYGHGLTNQKLGDRHLVVYNASGTNVSAARIDRSAIRLRLILDAKVYWAACESPEEADYLAAILNSTVANDAIKPFQSVGLAGERDVHKKVLELPIPSFDAKNPLHLALSSLGAGARQAAAEFADKPGSSISLAAARAQVRNAVESIIEEIDRRVASLLK